MAEGEPKGGKERPYWLPFVIAFAMWIILTIMFFRPDLVDRTRFTFSEWVTIGYLVTVIMFVVLLVWKITLNTEVMAEVVEAPKEEPPKKPRPKARPAEDEGAEEEAPPRKPPTKPKKKRVVVATSTPADIMGPDDELPEGLKRPEDVIDEDIEAMDGMPRVVEYPSKEPGGVYSDTLLKVDESLILNLRVLLGKVCHNCEELDDCKRRVEGKLDEDIFLYNFECKDGIKAELKRARKKREAEREKAEVAKKMVEERAGEAKGEEPKLEGPKKKAPPKKGTKKKRASKKGTGKKAPPKKGTGKKAPPKKGSEGEK
jgi:hypothetical protein